MDKAQIIKNYNLTNRQIILIDNYIQSLKENNIKQNLVGANTNFIHEYSIINDSLQLAEFILKKNSSVIDLGTGAGLPGLILSITGYTNIVLIDSKIKKINFIKSFAHEQKVQIKTICARVENVKNQKFDFIICRAFAPLTKILDYSLFFTKKNTSLLFLKGRNVKKEIEDAKKNFSFNYDLFPSKSEGNGFVLKINKYKKL